MKKKEVYKAGLTTFVMMMFGMIVILYLMGFTSAWDAYNNDARIEGEADIDLENEGAIDSSFSIGDAMVDGLWGLFEGAGEYTSENPLFALAGAVIAGIGIYVLARAGGAYIFTYLIPIIFITIFANIFIFPIEPVTGYMIYYEGIPLNVFLVVFLNLFMFLSIMEFIRGNN